MGRVESVSPISQVATRWREAGYAGVRITYARFTALYIPKPLDLRFSPMHYTVLVLYLVSSRLSGP